MVVGERYQFLSNMPDETVFEVDSFWAKPCRAYHVQHEPDQASIRQITELQDQIEATGARELHRMPVLSLHMTVLTLFPATASVATHDEALWSQHKEKWLERIGDVCASTRPVQENRHRSFATGVETDTTQYRPYIPFSICSFQTSARNVDVDSSVRFCHENSLDGYRGRPRAPVPIFGTYFSAAICAGLVAEVDIPTGPRAAEKTYLRHPYERMAHVCLCALTHTGSRLFQ